MHRGVVLVFMFLCIASGLHMAQERTPWTAPEVEKQKENPVKVDSGSMERGRELYNKLCLSCHGQTGSGDGPIAIRLGFSPGNLTDYESMNAQTDGELSWKIATGRDAMPGFKKTMGTTDEQIGDLVNFIRSLSSPPEKENDEK